MSVIIDRIGVILIVYVNVGWFGVNFNIYVGELFINWDVVVCFVNLIFIEIFRIEIIVRNIKVCRKR